MRQLRPGVAQVQQQVALPVLRVGMEGAAVTIQLALFLCALPALPALLLLSRTAHFSVHDGPPTRTDRVVSALLIAAVIVALLVMAALAVAYR